MPKNETIIESDLPAPETTSGGCGAYRTGLVLTALQKKLAKAESQEEKAGLEAEIEALEREMGF